MLLFYFCKSFISLTSANLSSIQSRKPYINIKAILLAFHESFEWSTLDMEDSYICPKIFLKEKTSEKVNFFYIFHSFFIWLFRFETYHWQYYSKFSPDKKMYFFVSSLFNLMSWVRENFGKVFFFWEKTESSLISK